MSQPVDDAQVRLTYATQLLQVGQFAEGLRALSEGEVVMVEPYLTGTSARQVAEALGGRPHRVLHLGVAREEVRRYGSWQDHARAHGLDAAGLREPITEFLWCG